MKYINVKICVQLSVPDNFSLYIAAREIEFGVVEGLNRRPDIKPFINRIEIEKVETEYATEKNLQIES